MTEKKRLSPQSGSADSCHQTIAGLLLAGLMRCREGDAPPTPNRLDSFATLSVHVPSTTQRT